MSDTLTVFSACLGFLSVVFAFEGKLGVAVSLILVCAIIDGLDGMVARYEGGDEQKMRFGVMLDSFSDSIAFCIAPAIISYRVLVGGLPSSRLMVDLVLVVCALYVACGILRLSRFNVLFSSRSMGFVGLPTTAAGLLLSSLLSLELVVPTTRLLWAHGVMIPVLSILMISSLVYPKPTRVWMLGMFVPVPLAMALFLWTSIQPLTRACALLLLGILLAYVASPVLVRVLGTSPESL